MEQDKKATHITINALLRMKTNLSPLMRMLQLADSAFPVGAFSFSNGLESAVHTGVVYDARTLQAYTRTIALQAAFTDGVAALHSLRSAQRKEYEGILQADRSLHQLKLNNEARTMQQRMGRKLAELGVHLFACDTMERWLADVKEGITPGNYPVAQGILFASLGLNEDILYTAHQYGVISMVLNAALRCLKVSHYDTQRILYQLSDESLQWLPEIRYMALEDMNNFNPQADILASLHEKGAMRMFMN